MKYSVNGFFLWLLVTELTFQGSIGIIIPAGASDDDYVAKYPGAYKAVFPYDALNRPDKVPGECAATVVHPRYAVTAAHCFSDVTGDKSQGGIRVNINGQQMVTVATLIDPCWDFATDSPNSHDLALLMFDKDINVEPVELFDDTNEAGQEFTLVGWGDTGTSAMPKAKVPPCNEAANGCKFRVAHNVVNAAAHGVLQYTFDDPSNGGLELEGLSYTGDSGGPAFIQGKIAGVNSGGGCCGYGSLDEYCRLADKLPWLRSAMESGKAPKIKDCKAFDVAATGDVDFENKAAVPPAPPTTQTQTDEQKEVLE